MKRRRPVQVKKSLNIKSILTLTAAFVLVAALSIGGTLAWLQATTETVTNTFTTAGIGITLTETKGPDGEDLETNEAWSAQLVPGADYTKNPTVAVVDPTDVPVYLFVKVEEGSCATYLDYTLAWNYTGEADAAKYDGWNELTAEGVADNTVYYRTVNPDDAEKTWELLVGNKVTVKSGLVEQGSTDENAVKMPTEQQQMTFTAYAIQTEGMNDAADAWSKIGN